MSPVPPSLSTTQIDALERQQQRILHRTRVIDYVLVAEQRNGATLTLSDALAELLGDITDAARAIGTILRPTKPGALQQGPQMPRTPRAIDALPDWADQFMECADRFVEQVDRCGDRMFEGAAAGPRRMRRHRVETRRLARQRGHAAISRSA